MDLMAKTMDWPGSDEIAERLRKMVPPQLLETGEEDGEGFTPAQVEAMIGEAVGNLEQQFEASLAERDMQVKEVKAAAEVASKMGPTEEKMREMVGGMLAEFVQQMGSGVESAT